MLSRWELSHLVPVLHGSPELRGSSGPLKPDLSPVQIVTTLQESGPAETTGLQGKQNPWLLQNRRRGIWQQWLLIGSEIWVAV